MRVSKPLKKRGIKIEGFFKNNQNTITAIGLIASLGISIYSISLSIKNERQAQVQADINKLPIWKNTISYNSPNDEGSITFESLREGIVLQLIEIEFPSDYQLQESSIKENVWFTGRFQDRMLELLQKYEHVHANPFSTMIDNQEYQYPIAITYYYLQENVRKKFKGIYYVTFKDYEHKKARIKSLYFRKELVRDESKVETKLNFLNNYQGVKNINFVLSQEMDSILSNHKKTRSFYTFIKNQFPPFHFVHRLMSNNTPNADTLFFNVPLFLKDSLSKKQFNDSLRIFLNSSKTNKTIKELINYIKIEQDSAPLIFKDSIQMANSPWIMNDIFSGWKRLMYSVKLELYTLTYVENIDELGIDASQWR